MKQFKLEGHLIRVYFVDSFEDRISIRAKKWNETKLSSKVSSILDYWILPSILTFGSVLIIYASYVSGSFNPLCVIFPPFAIFSSWYAIWMPMLRYKSADTYEFTIDANGIKVTELNSNHSLSWNEVNSYGIVDGIIYRHPYDNYTPRQRYHCIYFSRQKENTDLLKKRINKSIQNITRSLNTGECIVFVFSTEWAKRKEVYEPFRALAERYCESGKELSNLETWQDDIFP